MKKSIALLCLNLIVICTYSVFKIKSNVSNKEAIIGQWEGVKEYTVSKDGSQVKNETIYCPTNYQYTFQKNGRLTYINYIQDQPNKCIIDPTFLPDGKWEKITKEKYVFKLTKVMDNSLAIITPLKITFEKEGFMEMAYTKVNTPKNISHYYTIFSKVN
ncbi:MAG: hypothetical protein V3U92_05290 [Cellulophaga sp.]